MVTWHGSNAQRNIALSHMALSLSLPVFLTHSASSLPLSLFSPRTSLIWSGHGRMYVGSNNDMALMGYNKNK